MIFSHWSQQLIQLFSQGHFLHQILNCHWIQSERLGNSTCNVFPLHLKGRNSLHSEGSQVDMIKMKSQIDPSFSFDRGVAAFAHTWGPRVSGSRLWRANCLGEVRLKHILMDHIVTHTETHWYTSKIEMCNACFFKKRLNAIPDICHGRHGRRPCKFFWPV